MSEVPASAVPARDGPGRDALARAVPGCDVPAGDHWFEPLAAHMGSAYLRYSFTKGTENEVAFLIERLGLNAGSRVVDVGCGPGRHARLLAERGVPVHGIDISLDFVEIAATDAPVGATFERADARALRFDAEFDAAICLCQGAFGLMREPNDDAIVLDGIRRAVRVGGRLALSAFHGYFVVKHFDDTEFDPATGVSHERTEIRDPDGRAIETELWTGCYTVRELELLLPRHGWQIDDIYGVEPGGYAEVPPSVDLPELLVIATRTN